jgi:hypothetical protein
MALTSRKRDKLYFTYKEATAGTADTAAFFEGRGTMDFPEPDYQHESDYGKLGSGEHGKKAELQAVWTPFSYKPQRFSEIASMLAHFQGKADYPRLIATGAYMHELKHLTVANRVLTTFGFQYGPAAANMVMSGCTVNEFSLAFNGGGNGVVDATFSGAGNRHRISAGAMAENATGSLAAGEISFAAEPLLNYKSVKLFIADSLEATPGITSLSTSGPDLGANQVDITSLLSSFTITGSNGMNAENQARAGGYGLLNDFTRGDRRYTLEMVLRKDAAVLDINAMLPLNTQKSLEFQFMGPFIGTTNYRYSFHIFFPLMQILKAPENNESPVGRTVTTEIFEDANGDSMIAYVQSAVAVGYNATKV